MSSTYENNLGAIADAIRTMDGTTAPIPANKFAERILAINTIPDNLHTINVTSEDTSKGTVSGGGLIQDGMTTVVHASPKSGYRFSHWKENDTNINGAGYNYKFDVSGDRSLVAAFDNLNLTWHHITNNLTTVGGGSINNIVFAGYVGNYFMVTYQDGYRGSSSGGDPGVLMYSVDCVNWTRTTTPIVLSSIIYANGKYYAIESGYGNNSSSSNEAKERRLATSTDGITWTLTGYSVGKGYGTYYYFSYNTQINMAYGNNVFVIISSSGAHFYSHDFNTWNVLNIPSEIDVTYIYDYKNYLIFNDGKFLIVPTFFSSTNNFKCAYSTNGVTWTLVSTDISPSQSNTSYNIECVKYCHDKYMVLSSGYRPFIIYSYDLTTWHESDILALTSQPSMAYLMMGDVIYANNMYIVTLYGQKSSNTGGYSNTSSAFISGDGIGGWTESQMTDVGNWSKITFGGNMVVAFNNSANASYNGLCVGTFYG